MPRVNYFELCSNHPEEVAKFFSNVFDWDIKKWDGPARYWLVTTGDGEDGIDGGIMHSDERFRGTVNTVIVDDVDAYVERVVAHGGEVVMPRHAVPGIGYQAYCKDPTGNLFGIHQTDPEAK